MNGSASKYNFQKRVSVYFSANKGNEQNVAQINSSNQNKMILKKAEITLDRNANSYTTVNKNQPRTTLDVMPLPSSCLQNKSTHFMPKSSTPVRYKSNLSNKFNNTNISIQTHEPRANFETNTTVTRPQKRANEEETPKNESCFFMYKTFGVPFFTGDIDKIIKWHKIMPCFCHYEVLAPIVSLQEGSVQMQKIMLLRDRVGPVLKVIYYTCDRIDLPNFYIGQIIRCVGRMIDVTTMQVYCIREAKSTEISTFPRIMYVCEQEIKRWTININ